MVKPRTASTEATGAVPAAAALRRHQNAAARARESPDHPVGAREDVSQPHRIESGCGA